MHAALYPELTTDEVETIIGPIGGDAFPDYAAGDDLPIPAVELTPDAFGPQTERFTFERVATELADAFLQRGRFASVEPVLSDPKDFFETVRATLAADLLPIIIRPLADALSPHPDESPVATYRHFCQAVLADGFASTATANPVMWRRLSIRMANRVAALAETLQRLRDDWPELVTSFGLSADAKIVAVDLSGDTHGEGRNVSVIRLDDKSRVVYKPRSVDAEAAYEHLVEWLEERLGLTFAAARVVNKGRYGYMEFVESDRGLAIDMQRTGEMGALMYALNARDMHYTNILSTARGPLPIDLETVLHPLRHNATGGTDSEFSGYHVLEVSVFGTGVLPSIMTTDKHEGFVDVGYVGGGEVGAGGPFRQFRVVNPFSANVRIVWAPEPAATRREISATAITQIRSAAADMVAGFTRAYRLITEHRVEFSGRVHELFGDAVLRYIHNPTVQYEQCLRVATGSTASRELELAQGLIKRIGIAGRGADPRLVRSECGQLWATDIPYFAIRAGESDVVAGSRNEAPVAHLDGSPLHQFDAKLSRLGDADLATQVRLIRLAFNAKLPDPHTMTDSTHVLAAVDSADSNIGARLRDLAVELGGSLVDEMIEDRFPHLPRSWIGPVASAMPERPWPPGVLGYDLYTGRVGPALALAMLGKFTGTKRFVDAARQVFDPAVQILVEQQYELRSIAKAGTGAYNGFAGTLWALRMAGRVLGDDSYAPAVRDGVRLLTATPPTDDRWFDMISGGMGTTSVRMALGDPDAIHTATAACRAALESGLVRRMEYSGFAHGLAGLLGFAARAYDASKDAAAAELATAVCEELDAAFRTRGGLRTNRTGEENYSDSWCNGSAGVLVAESAAARAGLVPAGRVADTADGLWTAGLATSLTLCHGMLGLYDVLGELPGDAQRAGDTLRSRLGSHLSPDRMRSAIECPDVRYNQSPCLMVGKAGIVWHLLDRLGARPGASPLSLTEVAGRA